MSLRAPDLDHLALGVRSIDEVAGWARRDLGGREVARFPESSWRGLQMAFAGGIRLEALEPIDNPRDDFLVRFLGHRGEGPHHVTFKVPDIRASIAALGTIGIEPVKVDLSDPNWMECFLHPRGGLGTVVQLAQASGQWSAEVPPAPRTASEPHVQFLGAELRADLTAAERVFGAVLGGTPQDLGGGVAYTWPGGGTLVLRPATDAGEQVERLVFRSLGSPAPAPQRLGQRPLYGGPAQLVHLGPEESWPA